MNIEHLSWESPPLQPVLKAGDIHIWRISLHTASTQAQRLYWQLSNDELSRAQHFHFRQDRDNFVVVRSMLRILLGAYLQIVPQEIKFQYSVLGKPTLHMNQIDATLNFNLSHSRELALLAFTYNEAVGIDLEYIRPEIVGEQIAEQFFSVQETATLRGLPNNLQSAAFFNCWTRKEAFIKATGDGLSRPLDQFSVSLAPGEPARLLNIYGKPQEPSNWHIEDLDVGPSYKAALAVKRPIGRLYCWESLLEDM
jgi:4'-phosphopantetheinyl transferase